MSPHTLPLQCTQQTTTVVVMTLSIMQNTAAKAGDTLCYILWRISAPCWVEFQFSAALSEIRYKANSHIFHTLHILTGKKGEISTHGEHERKCYRESLNLIISIEVHQPCTCLSNLILLPLLSSPNHFLLIMHFRSDPATQSWTMLWWASSCESIIVLKCLDLSVLCCRVVLKKVLWIHTVTVLNFSYEPHGTPTHVCVVPACGTNTRTVLQHLYYMANGVWNHDLTSCSEIWIVQRQSCQLAPACCVACQQERKQLLTKKCKAYAVCCAIKLDSHVHGSLDCTLAAFPDCSLTLI